MALGSLPSLIQINTELGTIGQSLSKCIVLANKLGVWDRQSQFAYYSHDTIDVAPSNIQIIQTDNSVTVTINASGSWTRKLPTPIEVFKVLPTVGDGNNNSVDILLSIYAGGGSPELFNVYFQLDSDTSVTDYISITRGGIV